MLPKWGKMLKSRELILILLFAIRLSNAALDSYLLTHYDLKVKNNEATCRLVSHANLPEDRRTLAGRGCMCDEECVKYKDCCKDSVYYRPNDQSLPPSHHCAETTAVYLMAQCQPEWRDSDTSALCKKSVQPLEDDDITMILPISNVKTREVYGNRYCAACNNDVDTKNWVQFPMGVACGEAPPGYLKRAQNNPLSSRFGEPTPDPNPPQPSYPNFYPQPSTDDVDFQNQNQNGFEKESCNGSCKVKVINNIINNRSPGILLDIHLYIYNDTLIDGRNTPWPIQLQTVVPTVSDNSLYNIFGRNKRDSRYEIDFKKYASKAKEICSNAKYDKENKEFISQYNNKNFICRFGAMLPENSKQFTRRCVPFLERSCPDGYENETVKEECSIHTNIVYNKKTKKPYRNKDCARCNKEKEDSVDGEPRDTRVDLSSAASSAPSKGATASQGGFGPAG